MQNIVDARAEDQDAAAVRAHARSAPSSSACCTKLASQVDPEFKPFAAPRRADRRGGDRRCDRRLREDRRLPARGGARSRVRARRRQELRRHDGARRVRTHAQRATIGASSWRATGSRSTRRRAAPWEVKDVSQTGFRLIAPMSVANACHARARWPRSVRTARRAWTLGIVRRMKRHDVGPRRDRPADDREHARRRRPGRAAQGLETRLLGRRRRRHRSTAAAFIALFLALRKRDGEPGVQSLIVPAGEYQPGKRLKLVTVAVDHRDRARSACSSSSPTGCGRRSSRRRSARHRMRRAARARIPSRAAIDRAPARRCGACAAVSEWLVRRTTMTADRYAEICTPRYRWNVPAQFNIAQACCGRWARRPHALRALLGGRVGRDGRVHVSGTSQQRGQSAVERARRAGRGARRQGRARCCRSGRETVVAHLAVYQMGAVAVPLSFLFGPDALEYRLDNSEREGRDRRPAIAAEPRADPREAARARARDRRRGRARASIDDWDALLERGVAAIRRRSTTRADRPRADHLHERHDRAAEGRADAALRACSATCPASSIRTTASRSRATSSGRRPTGRGPAA